MEMCTFEQYLKEPVCVGFSPNAADSRRIVKGDWRGSGSCGKHQSHYHVLHG